MVKLREEFHQPTDGSIHPESWFIHVGQRRKPNEIALLRQAYNFCHLHSDDHKTTTGLPCLQQGLTMADILDNLNLDVDTVVAALVYPTIQYTDLNLDDLSEQLNPKVAKLIVGVTQMDTIRTIYGRVSASHIQNRTQLDNLRKMLLAMAEDVRVVLIKLAEYTSIMRNISHLDTSKQLEIARETQDIYAPLANRLGIAQMKWELEDLSFRYLNPEIYKTIAKSVDQKRMDRDRFIQAVINELTKALDEAGLKNIDINGRAKHIYSIYRKMQRKKVPFEQIYDASAVRVLAPTVENCYGILGIVHSLWQPIRAEFDDYIAHPKPNGYSSLHTAVVGPEGRNIEVQIRTYSMHQQSELGVAAHWIYKEGAKQPNEYEQKIAWLRQLIDWHKEVSHTDTPQADAEQLTLFEDRVYVFTPNGEIIDLPKGATPLDFAYTIHTEIGHRCKGAKVNGAIVPLTYKVKTGERIEILTTKIPNPSRDWYNPTSGYLKTSRGRAKVLQWFKKQDYEKHLAEGEALFSREIKKLDEIDFDSEKIAHKLNFKTSQDMLAALGAGDIRMSQILHFITPHHEPHEDKITLTSLVTPRHAEKHPKGINIEGIDNLMIHLAHCCKPVPGDAIVGFITQGRGVTIHRQDCSNITNADHARMVEVNWGKHKGNFPVDIYVDAHDRAGLLRDIAAILAHEKINIIAINITTDKNEQRARITATLEIDDLNSLNKIFDRIHQMTDVISVERLRTGL